MAVTPTMVRGIAPEFTSLADDVLTTFIGYAGEQVDPDAWGSRADLGVMYLTAHLLSVSYPSLVKGEVASMSAGPVSMTFAVAAVDPAVMISTRYGKTYLRLVRTAALAGAQVV